MVTTGFASHVVTTGFASHVVTTGFLGQRSTKWPIKTSPRYMYNTNASPTCAYTPEAAQEK